MTKTDHHLTPLINAAYAKLEAECEAIRAATPKIKGSWGLMETDTIAISEATAPLRAAYYEWLKTPEAQAERAAYLAWEAAQPVEVDPVEDDDDDEDEDEDEEARA